MAFTIHAKTSTDLPYSLHIGSGDEQFVREWFALNHPGSTIVSLEPDVEAAASVETFAQVKAAVDADKELEQLGVKQQIADSIKKVLPEGTKVTYG